MMAVGSSLPSSTSQIESAAPCDACPANQSRNDMPPLAFQSVLSPRIGNAGPPLLSLLIVSAHPRSHTHRRPARAARTRRSRSTRSAARTSSCVLPRPTILLETAPADERPRDDPADHVGEHNEGIEQADHGATAMRCAFALASRITFGPTSDTRAEPHTSDTRAEPLTPDTHAEPLTPDTRAQPHTPDTCPTPPPPHPSACPPTAAPRAEPLTPDTRAESLTPDTCAESWTRRIQPLRTSRIWAVPPTIQQPSTIN